MLIFLLTWASVFAATNRPPVRDLGGGVFEIGKVLLNQPARTVTFPALVNMRAGVVEYLVVTSAGKVHESVLRTEAEPFHIHAAMLLLGVKTAGSNDLAVFFDRTKQLPGERVKISASWRDQSLPIQELVFHAERKAPMSVPHWIYNGSQTREGKFLAQQEGSIISLIADPSALVNNPREDRENDELWTVRANALPEIGEPMQVTITLSDRP